MGFRRLLEIEKAKLGDGDAPTPEDLVSMEEAAKLAVEDAGQVDEYDPRYLEAKDLRAQGLGVKAICKAIGIGTDTYYRWFKPIAREDIRRAKELRAEEMMELRNQGWGDAAIARQFKCARASVVKAIGKRDPQSGPPKKRITIKWIAPVEQVSAVEKVARKAGAANESNNGQVSIPTMLDMIAEGLLIVTHNPASVRRVTRN